MPSLTDQDCIDRARDRIAIEMENETDEKKVLAERLAEYWVLDLASPGQLSALERCGWHDDRACCGGLSNVLSVKDLERFQDVTNDWDHRFDVWDSAWAQPFVMHAKDIADEVCPELCRGR